VVADTGLYLPLALVPEFDPRLVAGVVILSILTEMTGVIGVQIGASRRYDGPLGKSDRAFLFGVMGLLLGLRVQIERAIPFILIAMMVLLALTVLRRCRSALREVAMNGPAK
jgi:CDP-diacylglycerol--glycerol-3-phosphate 3-phosphatidyltransferase